MSLEQLKSPLERRMQEVAAKAGLEIDLESLTIGAFINSVREARGLSVKALAQKAQVQRPFLSLLMSQNLVRRAEGSKNRSQFEKKDERYRRLAVALQLDEALFLELIEFVQIVPENVDGLLNETRDSILQTLGLDELNPDQEEQLQEALLHFYRELRAEEI